MESPSESCLKSRHLELTARLDTTRVPQYVSATLVGVGRAGIIRGASSGPIAAYLTAYGLNACQFRNLPAFSPLSDFCRRLLLARGGRPFAFTWSFYDRPRRAQAVLVRAYLLDGDRLETQLERRRPGL